MVTTATNQLYRIKGRYERGPGHCSDLGTGLIRQGLPERQSSGDLLGIATGNSVSVRAIHFRVQAVRQPTLKPGCRAAVVRYSQARSAAAAGEGRLYGVLPRPVVKRIVEIDSPHRPNCHRQTKIIAAILESPVIERIFKHPGLQARAPPRTPAPWRQVAQVA